MSLSRWNAAHINSIKQLRSHSFPRSENIQGFFPSQSIKIVQLSINAFQWCFDKFYEHNILNIYLWSSQDQNIFKD